MAIVYYPFTLATYTNYFIAPATKWLWGGPGVTWGGLAWVTGAAPGSFGPAFGLWTPTFGLKVISPEFGIARGNNLCCSEVHMAMCMTAFAVAESSAAAGLFNGTRPQKHKNRDHSGANLRVIR